MRHARPLRRRRRLPWAAAALLVTALAATAAPGASAAPGTGTPRWLLESRAAPTNLPLAHEGKTPEAFVEAVFANLGGAPLSGEAKPVTVRDRLPAGLELVSIKPILPAPVPINGEGGVSCSSAPEGQQTLVTCTFDKRLAVDKQLEVVIGVKVTTEDPGEPLNELEAEGGNAEKVALSRPLRINGRPTSFGLERYEVLTEEEDGSIDLQAGSHPYQMTTVFDLNQSLSTDSNGDKANLVPGSPALERNFEVELPPGFIGDPNVGAQCTPLNFLVKVEENLNNCGASSAVGIATVSFNDPIDFEYDTLSVPVFNLTPAPGEPAQFGFEAASTPVVLNTSLRSDGDYGVTVEVKNAPQAVQVLSSRVTIWGTPGEASHNGSRGWGCLGWKAAPEPCKEQPRSEEPLLTMPTACLSTPTSSVTGETWPLPDGSVQRIEKGEPNSFFRFPSALTGCDKLDFSPTTEMHPSSGPCRLEGGRLSEEGTLEEANTPAGLCVHVHVPQQRTKETGGLAEATIKDTTVELPEGMLLSPSAANGLEACAEGESEPGGGVGYTGMKELDPEGEPGVLTPSFTRTLPSLLEPGLDFCPNGSKVGAVHIYSPDLPVRTPGVRPELVGGVYLADQYANPFGSLFAMYIVASEPESGLVAKFGGEVHVDPTTGRIVSTFAQTPQVPYEDLLLELFPGPRGSVTTPSACGTYEARSTYTSWSGTLAEPQTLREPSTFTIGSGPGGTPCASPQPLTPSFSAGSTNKQAGAYTNFELTLGHSDTDQAPTALTVQTPPGLAAMLSHVTPCGEPAAAEGTCGPESLIGEATATAGLGSEPFTETGGRVYITGPYGGAPFGLSVVIPTKAGPFDFGNVVTRSTINVDPTTAAVTIGSALPTKVETVRDPHTGMPARPGIPVQLKQIHVVVDRPEFEFNPTNCTAMSIEGTLTGAQGAVAPLSSPFQVTGCGALPFKPELTAGVSSKFSRTEGISFRVTVKSSPGQANIGKTKLVIPAALPSRLTTIQKACPDTVFAADPASCPEGSLIGSAVVHTPVLKSPLSGPAYLVSHGGAAFPDIEFVLKGEGILLILDGQTDIKHGVTTSTFNAVPDAPVESFESIFPAGPHSALGGYLASGKSSMCGQHLVIPTTLTGQNGIVVEKSTPVKVEGACKAVAPFKQTRLQAALSACRKRFKTHRKKRLACERGARRKYGQKKHEQSKPAQKGRPASRAASRPASRGR